mmetsp:Transcript_5900/g.12031  ORF Transcript_5900/g.12031 Transcript_5900/m.12031 type:complete len:306 (-) Transcript_5900:399-1316(-)|eukprot:CAMPEP_0118948214 /NCGR_PEP_ID=MMETSP1169-20130426/47421_1 /TAXON_ID=36882 /ORGANISM="Pyramimonas obovata, Strain CCMP722" /LENGTH=305 /DNA_ID=CAMNT_0006894591 /DNA_START=45 /DNA_END=962 /DNA_ORIENTATION=+
MTAAVAQDAVDAQAFKKLYPENFYAQFLERSTRPDGRPLGRARPTSIGVGAVSTAEGSALVKIGSTTMIAGVKLEVMRPTLEAPDEGAFEVTVEMPPTCSSAVRPGRPVEEALSAAQRVLEVLKSSKALDLKKLCIGKGQAAWMLYIDIFCLSADGGIFDASLAAAAAALASLQLPRVKLSEDGRVTLVDASAAGDSMETDDDADGGKIVEGCSSLELGSTPLGLTCGMYKGHLLADPSGEEEGMMEALVTVVMDEKGRLLSVYKPGGTAGASDAAVLDCIEMTRLRYKEVSSILTNALSACRAT